MKLLPTLLAFAALASHARADWQTTGDAKHTRITGSPADLMAAISLDVPPPGAAASLRFGPVPVETAAQAINVETEIISSIPNGKSFRLTLYLTTESAFPEQPDKVISRTNRQIRGQEKGLISFNATMPRSRPPGKTYNAFFELSSCDLDRNGKPGPPTHGKVSIRNLNLLTSTLPASPSAMERARSYLTCAGRATAGEPDGHITNRSALLLPGLLASIVDVKDPADPRLARFMAETCRTIHGLRENNTRIGPFEIYFPIANHASAKRILGPVLTAHPAYKEYEKTVLDHQSRWSDYKSTGFGQPRRPIREAKTIADVPAGIDNGNFRLLVTAAGYLSAQEFPEFKTVSKDPKSGTERVFTRDEILREMDLYIRRTYQSILTRNTDEYGAQTYLALDFSPIRLIAECANDPEIKRIAARTLDWLHTSLAACLNQGHYINSAARSKGEFLGTGSAIGFIGWLAFDTGKSAQGTTIPFTVYYALPGSYQLPPTIRPHQSFPFVKRERIGQGDTSTTVYTYQSKSFGMTSSIESCSASRRADPNWDRDGFFKEAGRHKLNWLGDKSGGFSPQWQNSAQPYAGRRNQPNARYYGTNPWSCVLQHRGTQIGLADVCEGYPFRKLYVSYPQDGSILERLHKADCGWTLCHTGRMIFAFRSLKPATLPNDPKPKGAVTDWYDYKKTAWILEVVEAPDPGKTKTPAEITSELDKLHRTLLTAKTESTHLDDADQESPTLTYTSPVSGRTLKLDSAIYPLPADGEGVPITQYPLLATYPDAKSAPRILQEKDTLLWLDGSGKPELSHHFKPLSK